MLLTNCGTLVRRTAPAPFVRSTVPPRVLCSASSFNPQPQPECPATNTALNRNSLFLTTFGMFLASEYPAMAASLEPTNPFSGIQANSLYVTLALFLMSVPGSSPSCWASCMNHHMMFHVSTDGYTHAAVLQLVWPFLAWAANTAHSSSCTVATEHALPAAGTLCTPYACGHAIACCCRHLEPGKTGAKGKQEAKDV